MSETSNLKYTVEVDASQFGKIDAALNKIADNTDKLANKAQSNGKSISSSFLPAAISIGGVALAIKKSLDAFNQQEKLMKQTQTILRATGHASGMVSTELYNMADAMSEVTNFDGEEILGGENTLLRFKNIGKEIFPQATAAMLDMAEAMGKDVPGAAQALGKALQNPLEASGALKKAGVDLTVQQEKQIESMMKAGDVAGAQKVILDELKNTIGGAARDSYSPWQKMWQIIGDTTKLWGEILMPTVKEFVTEALVPLGKYLKENKEAFVAISAVIAGLILAFTGPVGIIAAIALVGAAFYSLRDKWKTVLIQMQDMFLAYVEFVIEKWNWVFDTIGIKAFNKLTSVALDKIKELRAGLKAERDKIEADEKARNAAKDAEEAKRAAAGLAKRKKIASDNAKAEANKEETKKDEDKVRKWKDMYGDLTKEDIKYLRAQERVTQQHNLRTLRRDEQVFDKREKLSKQFQGNELDWAMEAEMQETQQKEDSEKQRFMLEQNMGNARLEWSKTFTGTLMGLMQSSNEEMFRIGQAAAIANAIINIAEGVTKAIAQGGFFGLFMGAAVAAAGAVQIATISSQTPPGHAEGGVVGGFNGATLGQDNTLIQARNGEMILPAQEQLNLYTAIKRNQLGMDNKPKAGNSYVYSPKISIYADSSTNANAVVKLIKKENSRMEKRMKQKAKMVNA